MKVKYFGSNIGVDGLTDGMEYNCLGIEGDFLRVIDNSGEDYLYPLSNPASIVGKIGRWVISVDSENSTLGKAFQSQLVAV